MYHKKWAPAHLVGAVAMFAATNAFAGSVTVNDNYIGSRPAVNSPGFPSVSGYGDVIGDSNVFDISSATFERVNNGNTLQVTINTNYAGRPGTAPAMGTTYGALFFGPLLGSPFSWALKLDNPTASSGSANLYEVNPSNVVKSHVDGAGWIFRADQAVDYTPSTSQNVLSHLGQAITASWVVGAGTITFSIFDNFFLGDAFSFHWAMTCGNDVIEGVVNGGIGAPSPVPLPAAFPLFVSGLGLLGFASWRRKKKGLSHAAA